MNPQIIVSGISLEDLQENIKKIIRDEVSKLTESFPVQLNNQDPEFITRKETAKILGISLPTLNEWTKTGVIPAYRISSRIRYKTTDILDSLKSIDSIKYKRI